MKILFIGLLMLAGNAMAVPQKCSQPVPEATFLQVINQTALSPTPGRCNTDLDCGPREVCIGHSCVRKH